MPGRIFWLGRVVCAAAACVCWVSAASADTFGTGANQFDMDFVTIAGSAGDGYGGQDTGLDFTTTNIDHDYRVGIYETTNDQWNKFMASLGVSSTGDGYSEQSLWTGTNVPANNVSWFEAAQFVNWLNTSTGHQAAYNFTVSQDGDDYALTTWSVEEADGTNLYRHKDAFYYLPTEDEWVKAAYWNGTSVQTWATPDDTLPVEDVEANYADWPEGEPWDVGDGSEELNGTFDMMGNVWEWMESPHRDASYGPFSGRAVRGSSYDIGHEFLMSRGRFGWAPWGEAYSVGFRVASTVPEPASLGLLATGAMALVTRRRR